MRVLSHRFIRHARPAVIAAAALAVVPLLAPSPAAAQATVTAEAGLGGYGRPQSWLPVRAVLTNQGAAARVGVSARYASGRDGGVHAVLPERQLSSGANEAHVLYLKEPQNWGAQEVAVDYRIEGRSQPPVRLQLNWVNDADWLVAGIGENAPVLQSLAVANVPANPRAAFRGSWQPPNQSSRAHVAILEASKVPDRGQGLAAADLVYLGSVGERELTPEQVAALRQYALSGGNLVIGGGLNWQRLSSELYQDLLPVRVTGSHTASSAPQLGTLAGATAPSGTTFAVATAQPKPGAKTLAHDAAGRPLVVTGAYGAGQVIFLAYDPGTSPFREWNGAGALWSKLLQSRPSPGLVEAIEAGENRYDAGYAMQTGRAGGLQLSDAPFAISQLDIPSFYLVALFLVAYIVCLVPVNYFFLKSRDKKEYAWLTTPLIVLVFSVGAYMIGYGYKGGRTLVSKVAVIEARVGEAGAPAVSYAGLFSPRKTTYDIQLASSGAAGEAAAGVLLSEPASGADTSDLRLALGDTVRLEDLPVDMWAMRVVKAEGVTSLGEGFSVEWQGVPGKSAGTLRNGSPYTLTDAQIVLDGVALPLPELAPGATVEFQRPSTATAGQASVPGTVTEKISGSPDERRMKEAVLERIQGASVLSEGTPFVLGWVREPVLPLLVDGSRPNEQSASLLLLRLTP